MLEIKDTKFFLEIVADAVAQTEITLTDEKERNRWINAIANGVRLLEDNYAFITWQPDSKSLLILSDSNQIYSANGVCQCKAYTNGINSRNKPFPCKHRALARIVRLYFELQEKPNQQGESSAAVAGAQPVLSNVVPAAPAETDITKAPYLKPSSSKVPEKLGNYRI